MYFFMSYLESTVVELLDDFDQGTLNLTFFCPLSCVSKIIDRLQEFRLNCSVLPNGCAISVVAPLNSIKSIRRFLNESDFESEFPLSVEELLIDNLSTCTHKSRLVFDYTRPESFGMCFSRFSVFMSSKSRMGERPRRPVDFSTSDITLLDDHERIFNFDPSEVFPLDGNPGFYYVDINFPKVSSYHLLVEPAYPNNSGLNTLFWVFVKPSYIIRLKDSNLNPDDAKFLWDDSWSDIGRLFRFAPHTICDGEDFQLPTDLDCSLILDISKYSNTWYHLLNKTEDNLDVEEDKVKEQITLKPGRDLYAWESVFSTKDIPLHIAGQSVIPGGFCHVQSTGNVFLIHRSLFDPVSCKRMVVSQLLSLAEQVFEGRSQRIVYVTSTENGLFAALTANGQLVLWGLNENNIFSLSESPETVFKASLFDPPVSKGSHTEPGREEKSSAAVPDIFEEVRNRSFADLHDGFIDVCLSKSMILAQTALNELYISTPLSSTHTNRFSKCLTSVKRVSSSSIAALALTHSNQLYFIANWVHPNQVVPFCGVEGRRFLEVLTDVTTFEQTKSELALRLQQGPILILTNIVDASIASNEGLQYDNNSIVRLVDHLSEEVGLYPTCLWAAAIRKVVCANVNNQSRTARPSYRFEILVWGGEDKNVRGTSRKSKKLWEPTVMISDLGELWTQSENISVDNKNPFNEDMFGGLRMNLLGELSLKMKAKNLEFGNWNSYTFNVAEFVASGKLHAPIKNHCKLGIRGKAKPPNGTVFDTVKERDISLTLTWC